MNISVHHLTRHLLAILIILAVHSSFLLPEPRSDAQVIDSCLKVVEDDDSCSREAMILKEKKKHKLFSLVLIRDQNRVLLGQKKRGFGFGKWNGFGGKVELGESILEAAKRELMEECGLEAKKLTQIGVLTCDIDTIPSILEIHVFSADDYRGDPIESEEMRPEWFPIDAIPYESMWMDDEIWFPRYLNGSRFRAYFYFEDETRLTKYHLEEVGKDIETIEPLDALPLTSQLKSAPPAIFSSPLSESSTIQGAP